MKLHSLRKQVEIFLDIDDCQPEPCQNNGTCTDLVNDYSCDCVAGFNGTNCENSKLICLFCSSQLSQICNKLLDTVSVVEFTS